MISRTLIRYFGMRFLGAVMSVFFGIFLLIVLVDYIEMMRRAADVPNLSAWVVAKTSFFRVPQLMERLLPFSVLVGAMTCYLALSRRNELVVARSAGMSAWQFVAPALIVAFAIGIAATALYNPLSAMMREWSKKLEADMFGDKQAAMQQSTQGFWVRQKSVDGQSIVYAASSQEQGVRLDGVSVFTFSPGGQALERIEAKRASLETGFWRLEGVRVYASGVPPREYETYQVKTNLTAAQVRESFSTPETVPFWDLPAYIEIAERSGLVAAGYKLQYQILIARPFLLSAMVLLACSVSLRFFRFGGITKMVLSGVTAGFLLYVLSKVTEDLSKAELLHPAAAAWLPVLAGGLTGFVVLLYQEDG
ncbi:MAG: lipopolysaccharide export system permease protein [Hyphomicrobiales bacterium]|jgi:lipopolysaccharide export system permease protein